MTDRTSKLFVAGRWVDAPAHVDLLCPIDGSRVRRVPQAGEAELEQALAEAKAAHERFLWMPAGERRRLLFRLADGLKARAAELSRGVTEEMGKAQSMAAREMVTAEETLRWAGEEVLRMDAELLSFPEPYLTGYHAITRRVPHGPIVAISPYNVPTYFVHKVAPAFAVGAPVLLKPSPQAPGAALLFAEVCEDAGLPAGMLSVLPCSDTLAERLACDARVAVVSFTGGTRVGRHLQNVLPRATRLSLELGDAPAMIVHDDANLDLAVEKAVFGGYAVSGQLCVSTQRLLVHEALYTRFLERFVPKVAGLKVGDPRKDPDVFIGPMVSASAAERVVAWLEEAVRGGARLLCGGLRTGNFVTPAVVVNAKRTDRVWREEVFGPVVVVEPYTDFNQAIDAVNASAFGLQTSVFTYDVRRIETAFRRLQTGTVLLNEMGALKSAAQPFGGVKDSGTSREGIRYAADEYTTRKTLILHSEG